MAKDQPISVKDAVHKLQLSLLEGIKNEDQLFAAGSLMSRSDYEDVVTERSLTNNCGYPLCSNPLPADRPRKGRYRISLKEHKVYDLHETYMFCSSSCVVNSKAFSGSLQDERCPVLDSEKLNVVLRLFGNLNLETEDNLGKNGDLGLSGLQIQEKTETIKGEVSLEQWVGPSNAVEGYVPQRNRYSKPLSRKNLKEEIKASHTKLSGEKEFVNEMDFMSTIITQDEYSVSKTPSDPSEMASYANISEPTRKGVGSKMVRKDDPGFQEVSSTSKSSSKLSSMKANNERHIKEAAKSHETKLESALKPTGEKKVEDFISILGASSVSWRSDSERESVDGKEKKSEYATKDDACSQEVPPTAVPLQSGSSIIAVEEESHVEKATKLSETKPKSSLKPLGGKKLGRSVTWADEKVDRSGSQSLCEVREMRDSEMPGNTYKGDNDDDDMLRFTSAEACALALSQAAEAVASGDPDVIGAVSEAGVIILPRPHDVDEGEVVNDVDVLEPEPTAIKWPRKPPISGSDFFDSEDSWFDAPPEGFSLTLSPFATMWNALFSWISSSSLAYIYGRDESFHEEYLSVNGREYPQKVALADGRSSEIKQTLASCLARALPGVVADLNLPIPISTLEQGLGHLLATMSLLDALPALRMKQWQVIALLFIDALSVCRLPALISYMTDRRILFRKVLDGTQIGMEEYEIMKDLIIPLGRVPQFSAQSGA
ncbi:RNA polymerase II subunit B1 CTD phosphatase RPAP2 [Quillaja saponaria]|uniref:RNA polymerase II subunit B1 CTD phosphatase RPAP2 homolog n=1 Tax=Quillaja saponaria TaxID=32244 RepID=A0AAD7Q6R3_QUISA|nr:RNA polymerase II subunit B1 CTD phosphatase RPAP2 [Quillaja saponaria]